LKIALSWALFADGTHAFPGSLRWGGLLQWEHLIKHWHIPTLLIRQFPILHHAAVLTYGIRKLLGPPRFLQGIQFLGQTPRGSLKLRLFTLANLKRLSGFFKFCLKCADAFCVFLQLLLGIYSDVSVKFSLVINHVQFHFSINPPTA
jgi:hypothetical protein